MAAVFLKRTNFSYAEHHKYIFIYTATVLWELRMFFEALHWCTKLVKRCFLPLFVRAQYCGFHSINGTAHFFHASPQVYSKYAPYIKIPFKYSDLSVAG